MLAFSASCDPATCCEFLPLHHLFLFSFVTASMSASTALILASLSSLSLSAGNSKQALRCKTCKMAAHLWCTSELSQQPCHGKVRIHSQNQCRPSFHSRCLTLLSFLSLGFFLYFCYLETFSVLLLFAAISCLWSLKDPVFDLSAFFLCKLEIQKKNHFQFLFPPL